MARRSTNSTNRRRRSQENRPRWHFRWKLWLFRIVLAGLLVSGAVIGIYSYRASKFDLQGVGVMKERSMILDMDGKLWGRLQGENRVPVKIEDVSPYFIAALLAREDTRFYEHWGVDPRGVARAVVRNAQGHAQGASTLTQQLVRNSYDELGPTVYRKRMNFDRKLLEMFVSLRVEKQFGKNQILEHYMNRIYFGSGVYGIEMASKTYFGKSAKDLTLGEAAMIAGIIRSPSKASAMGDTTRPAAEREAALKRGTAERDMVLARLASDDCAALREKYQVTPETIAAAGHQALKVLARRTVSFQENYAMDMIVRELDVMLEDAQTDQGGLKIYTTIDPNLQDEAQKSLNRVLTKIEQRPGYPHPKKSEFTEEARKAELPTNYLQGAVVVVDNGSGGIRALVGGRDYQESKFNRAIEAQRTIGSTFKPFVYAAAFAKGLSPQAEISDGPIQPGEIDGGRGWRPGNSDDKFRGVLPAEEGLIQSRNTMTVRVGNFAGLETVGRLAEQVGLDGMPRNPQSFIGNFGATPKAMTFAYTTLANGGVKRQGYLIERIDDAEGNVIYRAAHGTYQAMAPGVAQDTAAVMAQVFERGTAASAKGLGWTRPAAGKTGTTDDYHDAWFVGFTSSLTCGVWVGLDSPETIVPKGYGATLALPVWVDVMKRAPADRYPAKAFRGTGARPASVAKVEAVPPGKPEAEKPDAEKSGLRNTEPKPEGGLLRPFKKFFEGK